jgi:hypothetical protein
MSTRGQQMSRSRWRVVAAMVLLTCTPAPAFAQLKAVAWAPSQPETQMAARLYIDCDALLSGRFVGAFPESCHWIFGMKNFDDLIAQDGNICIPGRITLEQKIYVYTRTYLLGSSKAASSLDFAQQPWKNLVIHAFRQECPCR